MAKITPRRFPPPWSVEENIGVSLLLAPFIEGSAAHGGRVVALGRFQAAVAGEIKPRSVLILVEWECDLIANPNPTSNRSER